MSGSLFNTAGGYIDPTTGMWIPAAAQPTAQQAAQTPTIGGILGAVGRTLVPAAMPSQAAPSGPGGFNWEAAGDPYQQAPQPGGPIQAPPPAVDPTAATPNLPDPYRNAPSPASLPPSGNPGVASQAQLQAAPAPPTPAQAQASAADTSGANYNTDVQQDQQSQQPAQKANPNATPADYSSASPPPDAARALVVQNAAKKYGVPLDVANWVGFHESNWNNNVGTNAYGATGPWQFKKATADQYGLSDPNDFNTSTDAAMRLLADNFKKTGNWADAVSAYGTFSTGKGADADAAARNGFLQYAQNANLPNMGKGTQVAGPGAGTSGAFMPPQQQQQLSALGIDPSQFQLPFDYQKAVQPSTAEKLYRMAAALQGNAGQAAGLMAGDRQKMFEANNNALATQRLAQQLQYQNAGLNIRQQGANTAAQRAGTAQAALNARTDPALQGNIAAAKAAGAATVAGQKATDVDFAKKSVADITSLQQGALADETAHADNMTALQTAQQNPELMGTTLKARATRALTEMGVIGDANDLTALQKSTAAARNSYLNNVTGGHMSVLRAFAADKFFSQAVADVGSNPKAAAWVIQAQDNVLQARQGWRDQYNALEKQDPASVTGRNYYSAEQNFYQQWAKDHPLQPYQSGEQSAPGTNASGSTKGAATLRWDQASQRMVPM